MKRSSVFYMFGMALTRPSLTMAWTSGVDVFMHVCGQKADTSSNYCDNIQSYDKETFLFLSNLARFLDFFWKLPQFHTSNFRKIVRQHTEGMVGSITWILLQIYLAFQQWKNFENPLRLTKLLRWVWCAVFLGHPDSLLRHIHKYNH